MSSNDNCEINNMLDDKESTNSENFSSEESVYELFEKMVVSFKDQKFGEVTLTSSTEGIQLKAHRIILAAASEYFMAMFGGSFKEADAAEINFNDIDGHTLKSVISYIYTKTIELQTDTVENVLKASHLFQLNKLEITCCDYLAEQLDVSNCIGIALFAEHYNYTQLYETSFAFALENFMKLRSFWEFFLLDADQLIKLISSDELRVYSEEFVFHSLMAWIDYDSVNREEYLVELFRYVRLTLLQPKFIEESVEPAVCKSSECKNLIFEAYKWHSVPILRPSLLSQQNIKLRSVKDVMIAISGWNNTEHILSVGLYYAGFDKWIYRSWPGPSENRVDFGSTTLGDKLIIAGGKLASGETTNRVDCLDLMTLEWTQLSPLLTGRHSCGSAVLNDCIYIVGGYDESNSMLNSVEKWDPTTEVWQDVASLPGTAIWPYVNRKNDLLCVFRVESHYETNVGNSFTYNPLTNTWSALRHVNGSPKGLVTLPINGVDHLIFISSSEIVSTNLKTNVTTVTKSLNNFSDYKVAVFGDRVILYGERQFMEMGAFGILKTMPILQNGEGKVILISQ